MSKPSKETLEGYFVLITLDDVLRALMRGPPDTIRYGRMTMTSAYYCVLYDSRTDRSWGGVTLNETDFGRLRAITEGPVSFQHTTGVVDVTDILLS